MASRCISRPLRFAGLQAPAVQVRGVFIDEGLLPDGQSSLSHLPRVIIHENGRMAIYAADM